MQETRRGLDGGFTAQSHGLKMAKKKNKTFISECIWWEMFGQETEKKCCQLAVVTRYKQLL